MRILRPLTALLALIILSVLAPLAAAAEEGYYRFPALRGDTVIFTAEGDLWRVAAAGGEARRLTTHAGEESHAAISADGSQVAFSARYEGGREVYVMALDGGLPKRLTWHGDDARVVGWTPAGRVLYATGHFASLPTIELVEIDPRNGRRYRLPLAQADEGTYDPLSGSLYFTRFPFQGSHTKRYRGGTAQSLWRYDPGAEEAQPLTAEHAGTDHRPLWWRDRLLFVSDRDGTLNLWSMAGDGGDPRQHTHHADWDVRWPDLDGDRVIYQLGADLWLHDLASGSERRLEIRLMSDFDQQRQRWIRHPLEYLSAAHLSPDGERVVLTARGQIVVVPRRQGRLVEVGQSGLEQQAAVRYRSARFLAAGQSLVALSDESGEVEWWQLDARGVEAPRQLTRDGHTLRFDGLPSPDGRFLAYYDKNDELWLLELATGDQKRLASSPYFGFGDLAFSTDGSWLAYVVPADNFFTQIRLYELATGRDLALTSDRFNSASPAWSPDGRWLYFFSDRHLESIVQSPWGAYAPQPHLDRRTRLFAISLRAHGRPPFAPATELVKEAEGEDQEDDKARAHPRSVPTEPLQIDLEGLVGRLWEVPIEPGNYRRLAAGERHLYWLARLPQLKDSTLLALRLGRQELKPRKILDRLLDYELSADGKHLLLRREQGLWVVPAKGKPPEKLAEHRLALDDWHLSLDPRQEWRQMFVDAWRLMRDYFYDPGMHGVDWLAMRDKYLPLVDRVADRRELSALLAEMVGELSALHHFVRSGDPRQGEEEDILPASLGALLEPTAEGLQVVQLYDGDPDMPGELSPLSRPGVEVGVGDLIVTINGASTMAATEVGELLRRQAGRQVLLGVRAAQNSAQDSGPRQVIVEPLTPRQASRLRYAHWEFQRRLRVEDLGDGKIGYVHLRSMGRRSYSEWARHYFPVAQRQGLVIDLRRNRGGNIDSWILGSLLRRPWMWWKARTGKSYPNMQWSFRGHLVVLVDERTASDGEAFADGFRRLGLGSIVGTRTWGGEIWLTSSNRLVDRGIATAAEFGVYGPEGEWLIEGHGVDPDLVVDNLPRATWQGQDAQLEAAVQHLLRRIAAEPAQVPPAPPYPDKSYSAEEGGSLSSPVVSNRR